MLTLRHNEPVFILMLRGRVGCQRQPTLPLSISLYCTVVCSLYCSQTWENLYQVSLTHEPVRFQGIIYGISRALLGPLPEPCKGPRSLNFVSLAVNPPLTALQCIGVKWNHVVWMQLAYVPPNASTHPHPPVYVKSPCPLVLCNLR